MLRYAVPFAAALTLAALPLTAAAETKVPTSQAEIALGFAPLVKQAAPAVVNIYAKRVVQTRSSPFSNDPFFREFFRDFGETRPEVQNSLGSGVILSADGYVVSNYHVVGGATDIRVVLKDRREFAAKVMLADQASDLAILKLEDAPDMPFLTLRDSDGVEVGELALAIGNPFGIGQTVSSGIVSGLARSGAATGAGRAYFIQTDAAINPGNSGGALIDINGELIGVNTSILTRSGGSNGVGFAIPADLVEQFVAQARQGYDSFLRPWAGMSGQSIDNDIAETLGLDRPGGVLISGLHPASPFAAAGLQPGDVVQMVSGGEVNSPQEMIYRMSVAGMGSRVAVTYYRDGVAEEVDVGLILPPETPARDTVTLTEAEVLPGLQMSQVNPAVIAEFSLPLDAMGVIVEGTGPYAARVGLQRGDILLGINGEQVTTPSEAREILSQLGSRVAITVQRGLQRVQIRFRT
ncbi:trypsin-like peptidase domain-containing protein [Thalassovita mediterranea]|jgi:Do/DeqQ family serine protease|uniref:Periplasmic serine endoprotease DegP n=1 Tax=Thalassovita mediterranea TaxID=340021 RepID=A0A0P1GPQ3_9RHOB|nr:trypsin-like peptidase domain-containing protein [Thalassovita mediterranea]CUH84585.1 Periplasmic serine endoprotease DegP precursor [Thalassovita mediterranea]SIS32214.1 Do/DeqQ family serine protease [Thalassovita mediterranea]